MATLEVDRYIKPPRNPCPTCGCESKQDADPDKMICTNNLKTGGERHTWDKPSE